MKLKIGSKKKCNTNCAAQNTLHIVRSTKYAVEKKTKSARRSEVQKCQQNMQDKISSTKCTIQICSTEVPLGLLNLLHPWETK